jgi:hypothetical protein
MSIEAMKQAVEAFEHIKKYVTDDGAMPENWDAYHEKEYFALEALRQAIAEAEKESTLQEISDFGQWDTSDMAHRPNGLAIDDDDIQEYKKPWVGLTDEEIAQVVGSPLDEVYLTDFRRVIAKLKERNT